MISKRQRHEIRQRRLVRERNAAEREWKHWKLRLNYWSTRSFNLPISDPKWRKFFDNKETARRMVNEWYATLVDLKRQLGEL